MSNHTRSTPSIYLEILTPFFLICVILGCIAIAAPAMGESRSQRIIGGENAAPGEFPFISALIYAPCNDSYYDCQSCGGSLIAPSWVLTAAHCVYEYGVNDWDVVLNIRDLKNDAGELLHVKRIIVHPSYDPVTSDHDIALLELDHSVTYTPVSLIGADDIIEGQTATVIGWGNMSTSGESYPEILQQVDVPVVTNTLCNASYNANTWYSDPITDNMFCAGYADGGKDSCQGDSGGPILIRVNGSYRQIGIVSWGEGCALPGLYGVYTRVSRYLDWIEGYTGVSPGETTPPTIQAISDENATAGIYYTGPAPILLQGSAPVTWSLVSGPPGMTIDASTGVVSWADPDTSGSPYTITIRATNSAGSGSQSWQLSVSASSGTEIDVTTYIILTDRSAPLTIASGGGYQVTGSSGTNRITIAQGAQVRCSNFTGPNILTLEESSSGFSVFRSGATVYLTSADGTIVTIAAKPEAQNLVFTDETLSLAIIDETVMLGNQTITQTVMPLSGD